MVGEESGWCTAWCSGRRGLLIAGALVLAGARAIDDLGTEFEESSCSVDW